MGSFTNTHSATGAAAVTPNDSADLPNIRTRALIVGGAGYIKADFQDGSTAEIYCAAGVPIPVCVNRVYATTVGTIATGIVALY